MSFIDSLLNHGIVHCCCRDVYSLSMIGVNRNTVLEYFTFSRGLFRAKRQILSMKRARLNLSLARFKRIT